MPDPAKGAELAKRRKRAIELRMQGLTYDQIAEELKLPGGRGHVYRDLQAARREADLELRESIDEQRAIENARLDAMQATIWEAAVDGDLEAQKGVLRLMQHRARLNGLQAPQRIEFSVRPEVQQRIDELRDRALALENAVDVEFSEQPDE
jgi:hypothetical protein